MHGENHENAIDAPPFRAVFYPQSADEVVLCREKPSIIALSVRHDECNNLPSPGNSRVD
jgi:hypothetical protein